MIDLVITDVDGVLTDNRVWYNEGNHHRMWAFNQYDFEAFTTLSSMEIEHCMLSGALSSAFMLRSIHVETEYFRSEDKLSWFLDTFGHERLETTAFIGNDMIDLPLLAMVAIPGAPNDAHPSVRNAVNSHPRGYICQSDGGYGAFREFVDHISLLL